MSDIVDNNLATSATNLGTLSYDTAGTKFNIYQTDSVGRYSVSDDIRDYFTVNTIDLSEVKVDIHPTGLIGDYKYYFKYELYDTENFEHTVVYLAGDGGSLDDSWNIDHFPSTYNFTPYNGQSNYFKGERTTELFGDSSTTTAYVSLDKTSFNAEFHPHLLTEPMSDNKVYIYSIEGYFATPSTTGTLLNYDEISYVIDITPRSGTTTTTTGAESHLSSYGVTMDTANSFIMGNISNLSFIHSTCKSFGVTNDMIAEVLEPNFPGLTGTIVANYFASNGINSSDLGGATPTVDIFIA